MPETLRLKKLTIVILCTIVMMVAGTATLFAQTKAITGVKADKDTGFSGKSNSGDLRWRP